jgi:hypothetical protein
VNELAPDILERDQLVPDESPIAELMNLAYASHEITDQFKAQVIYIISMIVLFNFDVDVDI